MALLYCCEGLRVTPPTDVVSRADLALLVPVVPFLIAALFRLGGEPREIRRLKLLLDVLILAPLAALAGLTIAGLVGSQLWVRL